jgi:hypothetical protein
MGLWTVRWSWTHSGNSYYSIGVGQDLAFPLSWSLGEEATNEEWLSLLNLYTRLYIGVSGGVDFLTYLLASLFSTEAILDCKWGTQYAQNFHKSKSQEVVKKSAIFLNRMLRPDG